MKPHNSQDGCVLNVGVGGPWVGKCPIYLEETRNIGKMSKKNGVDSTSNSW